MSSQNDKINDLKLELQSAIRRKVKSGKVLNSLRGLERSLTEDISLLQLECDFILQDMQDLKNQISRALHQASITEICSVSEKTKTENHLSNIKAHTQEYEVMFASERKISELHNKELQEEEAQQEEIERQKLAKVLEINEQKGREAAAVENECDAIERECSVLTKRNRAIMLMLKRKLVEAVDTRRERMKKNGST